MSGQGIAGIIAGTLKICVNFWWFTDTGNNPNNLITAGVLYFGIASLVMIVVTFCTWALTNTQFYCYHQNQSSSISVQTAPALYDGDLGISESQKLPPTIRGVLRKIWVEALHVWLVIGMTLFVFPGFTTLVRNYDKANLSTANFIVILISLFQFWDTVGRTLPKWLQFGSLQRFLPIPIWLRFLFIPLFMISIYTDYFPYNSISYIVMSLFALSNGYFSTLCMMYGPVRVEPSEARIAGTLMGFFLQIGVFSGVHLAMMVMFLVEGNPVQNV